jgi:hypothetical protein
MGKPCIYLSPSAQTGNSCIIGDNEQDHMRTLGAEIYRLLSQDPRIIVGLCPIVTGTENERLSSAVWYSNNFMEVNGGNISGVPAYHVCLHSDAGGGKGVTSFYIGSGTSKTLAQNIHNELLNCGLSFQDRGCYERAGLYELKNTTASAVLIENGFHDNLDDATKLHNNINKIATCYCVAIYNTLGIDRYVAPVVVVTPPPVVSPNIVDNEIVWKQELIQKCLDEKLLGDPNWLNKYNDSIPVFAVCSMLLKLQYKFTVEITDLAKSIIVSEITNSKEKLIEDALKVIDSKFESKTINILSKK